MSSRAAAVRRCEGPYNRSLDSLADIERSANLCSVLFPHTKSTTDTTGAVLNTLGVLCDLCARPLRVPKHLTADYADDTDFPTLSSRTAAARRCEGPHSRSLDSLRT